MVTMVVGAQEALICGDSGRIRRSPLTLGLDVLRRAPRDRDRAGVVACPEAEPHPPAQTCVLHLRPEDRLPHSPVELTSDEICRGRDSFLGLSPLVGLGTARRFGRELLGLLALAEELLTDPLGELRELLSQPGGDLAEL